MHTGPKTIADLFQKLRAKAAPQSGLVESETNEYVQLLEIKAGQLINHF
jgi:hypothetical protein